MDARLAAIAARARVSQATVSRVLNDKPGVSARTRETVLAAVDALGYDRPSALRARKARLVGVIVPELTNPVFPAFVQAVESVLVSSGLTPVLCTQTPGGMSEDDYIEMLFEHGASGIIFASGMHADTTASTTRYHRLIERGVAAVFVNGWLEGIDAPFISCDDAAASQLAVDHLYDLGHRRIGVALGPDRYTPIIRRRAGFVAAMKRRKIDLDDDLIVNSAFTVEGGHAAGNALINAGATAIVCASDMMALGVIRAANAQTLDVPHDISVVGYDDSTLIAFVDPPLSTVRQPVADMGIAAVHALLDEIHDVAVPRNELLFRPELVLRASTGPARATASIQKIQGGYA